MSSYSGWHVFIDYNLRNSLLGFFITLSMTFISMVFLNPLNSAKKKNEKNNIETQEKYWWLAWVEHNNTISEGTDKWYQCQRQYVLHEKSLPCVKKQRTDFPSRTIKRSCIIGLEVKNNSRFVSKPDIMTRIYVKTSQILINLI